MVKEDVVYLDNEILLGHKKEWMPFASTQMDLKIIIRSEVSRTEKDKYMILLISFKKVQNNLKTKEK